ncbi:hypothetical protein QCA50_011493 [Cerrena zonata]|uniref:Uncharacterized protein n=1 Tax=Cerrena zonata TaxID=2478898 RepID=A0AAW0G1Y1_9APHY
MSLSTVTSAAYILTKYSRSYPPTNSRPASTDNDWQHFTNPTIRLLLDIRKTYSGDLESYRMRVVWSIDSEPNMMDVDHREVIFEDVDLLSFSNIDSMQHGRANSIIGDAGPPLKAVYRDCVVGFRYLHPLHDPQNQNPTYRRIQVNFKAATDASAFVDAIRQVCPCKENPGPTRARASTMVQHQDSQATLHPEMPPPPVPYLPTSRNEPSHVSDISRARSCLPARASTMTTEQSAYFSTVLNESTDRSDTAPERRVSIPAASPFDTPRSHESSESFSLPVRRAGASPLNSTSVQPSAQPYEKTTTLSINTPNPDFLNSLTELQPLPPTPAISLIPSSSVKTTLTAANTAAPENPSALLSSLRNIPTLYDLPAKDLEILVAQVVREDGFTELVRFRTFLQISPIDHE